MAAMNWMARFLGVGVACLLVGSGPGRAQDDKQPARKPALVYYGTSACIQCHSAGPQDNEPVVCRLTEVKEWRKDLHHPHAYDTLKGEWAARIGRLLGIKNVAEDGRCVSCHGVYIADKDVLARSLKVKFKPEEGVSCVACHGPSGEWYSRHSSIFDREEWRKLTRDEKEKKYGMIDLWNPERRVQICGSCHVGNVAEGKVVTHDMYAATHPPVSGFEIAAFGERMPRHWELMAQKPEPVKKLLHWDGTSLEQTRLAVEGGVAVFREAMKVAADQAKPGTRLDFAAFDCASCHHDLEVPSRRQNRDPETIGRPPLRSWPTTLLKLGFRQAAGERDDAYQAIAQPFAENLNRLRQAALSQPFGDSAAVASTAGTLAADAGQLLKTLQGKKAPYDRNDARRLLRELSSSRQDQDYDSARQTGWAFNIIYRELQPPSARSGPLPAELRGLDTYLYLPLAPEKDYLPSVQQTLLHERDYDPAEFGNRLRELAPLSRREQ
jgi:Cytochrome c554 and c-prime